MLAALIERPEPKPAIRPWPRVKPKLRMTTVPVFRVAHRDLEDFIGEVFGINGFDFLTATGTVEGTVVDYTVTGNYGQSDGALRKVEHIRSGRKIRDVSLILDLLCENGFIPRGKYSVETRKPVCPIEYYRSLLAKHNARWEHPECVAFKEYVAKNRPDAVEQIEKIDAYLLERETAAA